MTLSALRYSSRVEENCPRRPRRAPAPDERQQDADRSRRLLLAAALEEFGAKGYAGARVQEIAARAGVNKQLINYYFDSKEGLYLELQRTWLCRERNLADPDLPLADLAVRYLHDALTEPNLTRLMAWRGLTADATPDGVTADSTTGLLTTENTPGGRTTESAPDCATDFMATLPDRHATGELADDLDPASVRLAIMGAVMIPVVMPHLVHRIFGMAPDDPEFEQRYGTHLRAMIQRLGDGSADTDQKRDPQQKNDGS